MSTIKDVFTVQQAAEQFGVSDASIRRICIEYGIGEKITDHMRLLSSEDIDLIRDVLSPPQGTRTVKEVAEELDVTVSRIRQLCAEHNVGEVKRRVKYLTDDEVKLLKNSRRKPGRPKS